MSSPSRHRDVYVIGKLGSYELPTLARCEKQINQLTQLLRSELCENDPKLRARAVWDRDQVIDHWSKLSFEFHAQAAMRAAR